MSNLYLNLKYYIMLYLKHVIGKVIYKMNNDGYKCVQKCLQDMLYQIDNTNSGKKQGPE